MEAALRTAYYILKRRILRQMPLRWSEALDSRKTTGLWKQNLLLMISLYGSL